MLIKDFYESITETSLRAKATPGLHLEYSKKVGIDRHNI